ncbi:ras-related protein rab-5c [Anaeramoeba flamelloides]|uniref:Ras-related protein rab-5c n=1 Tax=Anaeramoeba flamelloides TaxID=1746091 RepID=A0ABQ8XSQ5_9EUKA|nr:ras-related protein rab-5c [Anaeramoeba flamelloides]
MSDIEEDECKVVLLGDTGVGKSCLVLQFCYGKFEDNIDSTIGASYITKQINVSNQILKLQIWDTAGQERYQSLAPMYYRGSEIAIVIFDITSQDSFIKAKQWILEVAGKEMPNLIIGMVGNKIDLEKERVVSSDMAEEYCSLNKNTLLLKILP